MFNVVSTSRSQCFSSKFEYRASWPVPIVLCAEKSNSVGFPGTWSKTTRLISYLLPVLALLPLLDRERVWEWFTDIRLNLGPENENCSLERLWSAEEVRNWKELWSVGVGMAVELLGDSAAPPPICCLKLSILFWSCWILARSFLLLNEQETNKEKASYDVWKIIGICSSQNVKKSKEIFLTHSIRINEKLYAQCFFVLFSSDFFRLYRAVWSS